MNIQRLHVLERAIKAHIAAPTVPIYNTSVPMPEDAVKGQVAIGSDNSFNWYGGTSWHTVAGIASVINASPQDVVEGQIAIGSDGSFHWYVNGQWYSAAFQDSIVSHSPQDVLKGQVAIGTDGSFHWHDSNWHTFI